MNPFLNPNLWANMFHKEEPYFCKNMYFLLYFFLFHLVSMAVCHPGPAPSTAAFSDESICCVVHVLNSSVNTTYKKILRQYSALASSLVLIRLTFHDKNIVFSSSGKDIVNTGKHCKHR